MNDDAIKLILDRRAELQTRLTECDGLLTLLGYDPDGDDPPPEPACELRADAQADAEVPPRLGKPLAAVPLPRLSLADKPVPAAQPPAAPGRGKADSRRHQIARLLKDGPMGRTAIAEALGLPLGSMDLLLHPWFEKAGPGLRDPYRLTDLGREQALATDGGTAGTAAAR